MTKQQLVTELQQLSKQMMRIALIMEIDFDEDIKLKGIELKGASLIAKDWAECIGDEDERY